jgi:CRP-like cAMP-binding protein
MERLKVVFSESLFGPEDGVQDQDFVPERNVARDIEKEMEFFRTMKLDDVVEYRTFEEGSCILGDVRIDLLSDGSFQVNDREIRVAEVPAVIDYRPRYHIGERLEDPFIPPMLAVTSLGTSSGFDPAENTSGFIIWVNHHGIMIDPPVNATEWLLDSNVSPRFIDSIILTHCHADHDAGTFQKILEEGRVTIYSTRTIMDSFLRKYAALTGSDMEYLSRLFEFVPVVIGKPLFIHGASFEMFYTLHSIPTIGFRMVFGNQSMTYSSDHNNMPEVRGELFEKGFISEKRFQELENFPWDSSLIFHESGMAPLHTDSGFLAGLPEDVQERMIVYHLPKKRFPSHAAYGQSFVGIDNTLFLESDIHPFENAYRLINLFCSIDLLRVLVSEKLRPLLALVELKIYSRGDKLIEKGTRGDRFFIIYAGNVSINDEEGGIRKVYGSGDFFGEMALLDDITRSADVIAETEVVAYTLNRSAFLYLIQGTEIEETITRLSVLRQAGAGATLETSNYFRILTSSQKLWLEAALTPCRRREAGTRIIHEGQPVPALYVIRDGRARVFRSGQDLGYLEPGDLVGCVRELYVQETSPCTIEAETDMTLFRIDRDDFRAFLDHNPGLIMKLQYTWFS